MRTPERYENHDAEWREEENMRKHHITDECELDLFRCSQCGKRHEVCRCGEEDEEA